MSWYLLHLVSRSRVVTYVDFPLRWLDSLCHFWKRKNGVVRCFHSTHSLPLYRTSTIEACIGSQTSPKEMPTAVLKPWRTKTHSLESLNGCILFAKAKTSSQNVARICSEIMSFTSCECEQDISFIGTIPWVTSVHHQAFQRDLKKYCVSETLFTFLFQQILPSERLEALD